MPPHLTTEEAKRQQLPGFDVYRYTHLLYHDDLNRDFGVVRLNLEALKAFSDTVAIAQRHAIAAEQLAAGQWLAQGGFDSGLSYPWGAALHASMEYANYEHLKIASAFELHLKARLLSQSYILHDIDGSLAGYKGLASEQRDRPIDRSELIAVQSFHFDGALNYLPGLKESSLKFSLLTDKPHYRASLTLPPEQIDIIRDYRLLRNQIHFPGDILEAPHIQAFPRPIIDFLVEFINSEIIAASNTLIAKHKFNYAPLVPLS